MIRPHRTIQLNKKFVGLFSSEHPGWAVLEQEIYDKLTIKPNLMSKPPSDVVPILKRAGLIDDELSTNPDNFKLKRHFKPHSLILKLTGTCNIACTYCYDYNKNRFYKKLPIETAKYAISQCLKSTERLDVCFHGGEPLLEFQTIAKLVKWCKSEYQNSHITFNVQTNGLLLNQEKIQFLSQHNFSVGISWDGVDTGSNSERVLHNGNNTSRKLLAKYLKFPDFFQKCGVLAVVSKTNIKSLPAFALWLQNEGFKSLSYVQMDRSGRGEDKSNLRVSVQEWIDLNNIFLEMIHEGQICDLRVKPIIDRIDNLIFFQRRHMCSKGPCGSGNDMIVVDVDGNWRGCDTHYADEFVLGKIDVCSLPTALKSTNNKLIDYRMDHLNSNSECSDCVYQQVCGGTCPAKAKANNGDFFTVEELECSSMKSLTPKIIDKLTDTSGRTNYYHNHHSREYFLGDDVYK